MALTRGQGSHAFAWKIADPGNPVSLTAGTAEINEIHLSADGRLAAAACADQCVRVWNTATGTSATLREETQPGEFVDSLGAPFDLSARNARGFLSLQLDPRGQWVAAINDLGHLCLWEISSGHQLLRWKLEDQSRNARLSLSADGAHLALVGGSSTAIIFDLAPAQAK
jgi:WD40 repeat protein